MSDQLHGRRLAWAALHDLACDGSHYRWRIVADIGSYTCAFDRGEDYYWFGHGDRFEHCAHVSERAFEARVAWAIGVLGDSVYRYRYCHRKVFVRGVCKLVSNLLTATQAYWIDFGFSFLDGPASWRTPIAIQLIFAITVVFIVWGLPESPRWLAKRGRLDEALEVICAINDLPQDDPYVVSEMESIRQVIALEQEEGAQKWTSVFKKDVLQTRRRVGLAWFGLFMNQLSGINLGMWRRFRRNRDLGNGPR